MTVVKIMLNLLAGVVICILCLWVLFRFLTSAAVWVAQSMWGLDVKVGQVGLFMLGKITLSPRPGIRVDIERLWLSSSYINSDIKKPIAVCVGEVRIQLEQLVTKYGELRQETTPPPTLEEKQNKMMKILGWVQHVCLSVDNINVIFVEMLGEDMLTHVSIQEVEAHTTVTENWMEAYLSVENMAGKVLKNRKDQGGECGPCLAELGVSTSLRLALDIATLSLQIVETSLKKTHFSFSDGAFMELDAIIRKRKSSSIARSHVAENLDVSDSGGLQMPGAKFLPKEVHLHSEDLEIILSKDAGRRKAHLSIQDISVDVAHSTQDGLLEGHAVLAVRDLVLASPHINLANLGHMELKAEASEKAVTGSWVLRSCFFGYHHEEVQYWIAACSKWKEAQPPAVPNFSPQHTKPTSLMPKILSQLCHRSVSLGMDIEDGSVMVATATCPGVKSGVSHVKLTTTLRLAREEDLPTAQSLRSELELQGLYCKLTDGGPPSADLSSKLHHWGNVIYLGILLIKVNKIAQEVNVDSMLDSLQFEWSSSLATTISQAATSLLKKPLSAVMQPNIPVETAPVNLSAASTGVGTVLKTWLLQSHINVQCSSINVYIVNQLKVGVLIRNDTFSIQYRASEAVISCHGNKLAYFHQKNKVHNVVRCHDIQHYSGFLKMVDIGYKLTKKEISVKLTEEVFFHWATALHMVLYEAGQQVLDVRGMLQDLQQTSPSPVRSPSMSAVDSRPVSMTLSLRAVCNIIIQLSKEHRVQLSTSHSSASFKSTRTTIKVPQFSVNFDQHKIFAIESLRVAGQCESDVLKMERQGFDTLQLPNNKCWTVELETIHITFPYQYNFAEAFEQLVNLNKWRKLVHHVTKVPFTSDSPLPPDLHIKVKSLVLQVNDDEFEVKLGDNYELLTDEWRENEKRWAAMENRIEELRKQFTLLPASKMEELYVSLHRKSAEVYIHRSRQLYAASPMRTKLMTWTLDNLEIIALADSTLHGKDNVVAHMQEIDQESPYPEDGLNFTTLWCRMVHASTDSWQFKLRDYPTPWLDIQDLHIWGRLIGAEQVPTKRGIRSNVVEVSSPWGDVKVQRFMPALKFYHDFSCDVNRLVMAYGPCWDPAVSQFNLCLNLINRPSVDPSKPLPFWDKFRLLFHGRMTMCVQKMHWLYHASLNPNNTTEFMDWKWTNLILDWTNAKWVLRGDLDVFARTASKYDDCRLLHLPNLRFCLHLDWVTLGDPNDHHSVMPCAPDRVPEYSLQEHDSYRAFRSMHLNFSLSLETKPNDKHTECKPRLPSCLFYASTLRWMDKVKMCMSSVSKPIRRGKYWQLTEPRKPQISRHVRNLQLSVSVHEFKVCYWISFAKQHGVEMMGSSFKMEIGPEMVLVKKEDGLLHRACPDWSVNTFTAELNQTTIWLLSIDLDQHCIPLKEPKRSYFLSIENLIYERDAPSSADDSTASMQSHIELDELPASLVTPNGGKARHKVQIYDLKLAWTPSNRNVAFNLHDIYNNAQELKKNLASDALKGFKVDMATPSKSRSTSFTPASASFASAATPSPLAKLQHSMLQKLVSEADSRFVAVSEEVTGGSVQVEQLHGIAACKTDDVVNRNWHIVLYNSQVLLRGYETTGYVIVSASSASIRSYEHEPVWQGRHLKSKTTWVGKVSVMQYFATVGKEGTKEDQISWLSAANVVDQAEDPNAASPSAGLSSYGLNNVQDRISTDRSVGGVIVDTSFACQDDDAAHVQLQRIISRCSCEFFYASYGEVDPETTPEVPPPPNDSNDMMQEEEGADSFTLRHHDLNICTNPAQYERVLDIVNNLLLYVEPHRKEAIEKLQNMRFKFALSNMADMRTPILERQDSLRDKVACVRQIEREIYMAQKMIEEDRGNEILQGQIRELQENLEACKHHLNVATEELTILISCYKESQLQIKAQMKSKGKQAPIVRRNEIFFQHAEWRMTEEDGQIGIADLVLRNFLYSKVNREDDSGIHQLELGWVQVTNLLPNTPYKDVLAPQEMGESNHQMALRIQCRFKAPVGGIAIREHFEVNIIPMSIQLTHRFYTKVMAFFFPGKKIDVEEQQQVVAPEEARGESPLSVSGSSTSLATMSSTQSQPAKKKINVRSKGAQMELPVDDIDKMKARAQNNMFVYVKIPEVHLRVSYKGSKDKNLIDVQNLSLQLPTLQYHNETWTWFDFLMAVKKESRKALIGQAIKQKLHMKSRAGDEAAKPEYQQEDKARLLLGSKLLSGDEKKSKNKKSLFGKSSNK